MSGPELNESSEREPASKSPRWMVALSLLVFGVFYLAEPHNWRFSTSGAMHLNSSEESVSERIQYNIAKNQTGSSKRRVGLVVLGGYGAWCLLRREQRRVRIHGALGWTIVAFLSWIILSLLWSIDPLVTLRRVAVLFMLCVAALGIARRFSLEELGRLTLLVTGYMMVGGLACELALGSFQPWAEGYRFSGLTWPAFTCWNLSLFVIGVLTLTRQGRRRMRMALATMGTILALLTKTRAGAAALAMAVMVHLSSTWSAAAKVLTAFGTCFLLSCVLLIANMAGYDPARLVNRSVNLGREESAGGFSGRAGVWSMLLPYIVERPLHGYGYESFWTTDHLREIGERNWGAPDAHNGYINLTLGVGLVGSVLYATALLLAVLRSRRDFLQSLNSHDLFPGCVALITAVNTLCVASQLNPHVMSFISLIAFAHLGFIEESEPRWHAQPKLAGDWRLPHDWRPSEHAARPA